MYFFRRRSDGGGPRRCAASEYGQSSTSLHRIRSSTFTAARRVARVRESGKDYAGRVLRIRERVIQPEPCWRASFQTAILCCRPQVGRSSRSVLRQVCRRLKLACLRSIIKNNSWRKRFAVWPRRPEANGGYYRGPSSRRRAQRGESERRSMRWYLSNVEALGVEGCRAWRHL